MCRSVPQIPAETTSSTTWPGAGEGSGRSAMATLPKPGASLVSPRTLPRSFAGLSARVYDEQNLPDAHAREPAGDRIVADRVDHPAQAAVAEAEHDQRRDRRPHREVVRDVSDETPRAERPHEVRDEWRKRPLTVDGE